jgi:hypothetical protein
MARQTGDEDVRTTHKHTRRAASDATPLGGGINRDYPVAPTTIYEPERPGVRALSNLLVRDDGWIRAIPDGEGKSAYLKWKFTRGTFAGHYVMVVVDPWDWEDGFRMLEAKIRNCYAGNRKPTRDRAYDADFDDSYPG